MATRSYLYIFRRYESIYVIELRHDVYLFKEGSRMEGTLDFDTLDLGANF